MGFGAGQGRPCRRYGSAAIPEFEACAELARSAGVPVRDVLAAAGGAFDEETD